MNSQQNKERPQGRRSESAAQIRPDGFCCMSFEWIFASPQSNSISAIMVNAPFTVKMCSKQTKLTICFYCVFFAVLSPDRIGPGARFCATHLRNPATRSSKRNSRSARAFGAGHPIRDLHLGEMPSADEAAGLNCWRPKTSFRLAVRAAAGRCRQEADRAAVVLLQGQTRCRKRRSPVRARARAHAPGSPR